MFSASKRTQVEFRDLFRPYPALVNAYSSAFLGAFSSYLKRADDGRCTRLLKDEFKTICQTIDYGASFDIRFKGMKELPVHCDYHPGNLKYHDGKGVGLFDFDWSKIDYRLFDVALSLIYFTSIWDDQTSGLRQDKFTLFLNAYNNNCRRFTNIYPLTKQEQSCMFPMLAIANLYVLNWTIVDFYRGQYMIRVKSRHIFLIPLFSPADGLNQVSADNIV